MKKIAIILILILCVIPSFAQEQDDDDNKTNIRTTRQGFGDYKGIDMSLGFVNGRLRTEGSAYYFEDWNSEGIILIKDKGRVKIKGVNINLYNNKLEALYDENNVFTFDSENLIRIVINDKIFRTFNIDGELKIFELFFNDKISIYRHHTMSYSKGSANPMLNRKTNKYIKKANYYVYREGELTKIKLSKKSFSKLFQSDKVSQESIVKFIDQYKLSLHKETDLIKVLSFVIK